MIQHDNLDDLLNLARVGDSLTVVRVDPTNPARRGKVSGPVWRIASRRAVWVETGSGSTVIRSLYPEGDAYLWPVQYARLATRDGEIHRYDRPEEEQR